MNPGTILIQGSRGGIVDEAALAVSLTAGHLGGAAVDVYSTEPPAPDNPLLGLDNVIVHDISMVPEPGSLPVLVAGFVAFVFADRVMARRVR